MVKLEPIFHTQNDNNLFWNGAFEQSMTNLNYASYNVYGTARAFPFISYRNEIYGINIEPICYKKICNNNW